MVASSSARLMSTLGRKSRVAVLQPFLKQAAISRRATQGPSQDQPRASVSFEDACSKLDEAVALVDTLGCEVVLRQVIPVRSVNPKFLFGSGKVSEMSGMVSASEADAVFVNAPLSGAQQKGLTDQWGGAAVLDRFRVILDIFADRARTTEAKLQVELAGLKYEAAHLVQSGAAGRDSGFDRQGGGGGPGAMGGAGEKALEIRRRLLRDRTAEVGRLLGEVEKRRGVQRRTRDRRREPTVALVGYTNVGKSTLLNRLSLGGRGGGGSGSGGGKNKGRSGSKGAVHAHDRVFDTLDPTSRSVTLPSLARCVMVDTVGFIQDLPTALIHSFKATLEEVQKADVLLHVRDASVSRRVSEAQRVAVEETLRELGAAEIPTIEVWNKSDQHGAGEEKVDEVVLQEDAHDARGVAGADADGVGEGGMVYLDPEEKRPLTAAHRRPSVATPATITANADNEKRKERREPGRGDEDDAAVVRVSAATGEGLSGLLAQVDALLNLGGNARLAPPPAERYRYVNVLPGQQFHRSK